MEDKKSEKGIGRRTFLKTVGLSALGVGVSALPVMRKSVRPAWSGQLGNFESCRIVVFGVDSLRVDYAPTLISNGAQALSSLNTPICSLSGGTSGTQAGWAAIWSGMPSYYTNTWTNREFGAMPKKMHIMRKLMNAYKERDLFAVWITGKGHNIMGKRPESPHYSVYEKIVKQGYPGLYYGDEKREDQEVYDLAVTALQEAITHDNFCCFIHFRNPDDAGHEYKDYDTYIQRALEVDEYIWSLMNLLPPEIETDIIYCSDHGFDFVSLGDVENNHHYSPRGTLATNFATFEYPYVCQLSVGRLVYRKAGGNPDRTKCSEMKSAYKMYGVDLV